MRIHTGSMQRRAVSSTMSLDNSLDPSLMDTSVPAVFPPALRRYPYNGLTATEDYEPEQSQRSEEPLGHGVTFGSRTLPTVSERVLGYGRRSNDYDDNGIEVQQLANGDLTLIGNRLCREDSGISINDPHRMQEGRFERLKKICSFGTLSSNGVGGGSDSEGSTGISKSQHWMLLITPVVSSFSLALVIAAVVGPQWLLTEEKIPITTYNSTHGGGGGTLVVPTTTAAAINSLLHNQQLNIQHPHLIPATKDDVTGAYLTKYTKSSLWMLCSKYSGGTAPGQSPHPTVGDEFQCSSIDYFPSEGYSPDPNDSTNAIPYTVTHSSPFFLASNGVLIVSYGLFLVAMCSTKHKICYFVSGVLFIISGLLMLIGLIMYISILKAEIGSKLRPRSSLQAPQFTFRYGQSFLLYVFGFIITELSGILNVLIYSNVQQDEYSVHDGNQSAYPTYQNLSGGIHYNIHYRRELPAAGDELVKGQNGPPIVDYRYPYDGLECEATPRYYFEQQQPPDDNEADCRIHRRSFGRMTHDGMSKSLTDLLYMEPTQAYPDREIAQSRVRTTGDGQRTDRQSPIANLEFSHWSSTGKLTRSVSTYTDLQPVGDFVEQDRQDRNRRARSRSPARSDDEPTEKQSNICGLSRQYLSRELSKEKLFNEFCKKVGPRPKPKDIYYIESDGRNGDNSYRSVFVVEPSSPLSGRNRSSQRRRNSMADTRRRVTAHEPFTYASNYRQRIHSDNSLDDLMNDAHGRYKRRRDPIGRARSVDYRQTLPRNFQQRSMGTSEPEDETGGFGERIALERKRVSASGLLLEPERMNASHGDLSPDGIVGRWYRAGENHSLQNETAKDIRTAITSHCPKYHDPPPPTYTSALSTTGQHQQQAQQRDHHLPSSSHMYRSYGDLSSQQDFRRPTILSPHVFSPIKHTTNSAALRPILSVVHQQQPHRHVHHQHHRHNAVPQQQQHAETTTANRNHSLPSPVFDLDRIEQERRKSHSQLFLSSPASSSTVEQYDFVNGTAV